MYAHQVVEDIKTHNDAFAEKYRQHVIEGITNSQKFFLGQGEDINASIKRADTLFLNEPHLGVPYDVVWFEYDEYPESSANGVITTKEAVLMQRIIKGKELFWCDFVAYFPYWKKWRLSPVSVVVKVNRLIDEFDTIDLTKWGLPRPSEDTTGNFYILHNNTAMEMSDEDWEEEHMGSLCNLTMVHKALMLLNCKNITTEIIKAPDALNKKRRRNGKQEIFDYHVLNVVVPSKKQEYRVKTIPLFHVRVHLCRGHFKEYTEEHPLFGKYTGLYWWQPYVRGQNKNGVIIKDYNVSMGVNTL